MEELFSIVMPVFNRQDLVSEAVKSYLKQTIRGFELILVDDGSTDRSYEICQNLAKSDGRIKAYRLEKNSGVAVARHFGNTKARNTLIVVADSDDVAYPNRLEELEKLYLANPNASVFYTNVDIFNVESGQLKPRFFQPYNKELLCHINYIPNVSAAYSRKDYFATKGYRPDLKVSEDYDLWLQFADKNAQFAFSPIPTVKVLYHPGSIRVQKQDEHKSYIDRVRKDHCSITPNLKTVKKLANDETYKFFSKEEKIKLWFES